jgi:hypothetical protein
MRGQMTPFDQASTIISPRYEFPPFREPPTTVPLGRFARPSEPINGYPGIDNTSKPLHALWNERESAPPSQPLRPPSPSLPLSESPQPEEPTWMEAATEPNFFARDASDDGDAPLAIEPGSDFYRRLMLLKRLVRQRVYNEGFAPNETPEQYHIRYSSDEDDGSRYGE